MAALLPSGPPLVVVPWFLGTTRFFKGLSGTTRFLRMIEVNFENTNERVFSALKVDETYLRNTMGQARLNHIMMMYVQKEAAKKLLSLIHI